MTLRLLKWNAVCAEREREREREREKERLTTNVACCQTLIERCYHLLCLLAERERDRQTERDRER